MMDLSTLCVSVHQSQVWTPWREHQIQSHNPPALLWPRGSVHFHPSTREDRRCTTYQYNKADNPSFSVPLLPLVRFVWIKWQILVLSRMDVDKRLVFPCFSCHKSVRRHACHQASSLIWPRHDPHLHHGSSACERRKRVEIPSGH